MANVVDITALLVAAAQGDAAARDAETQLTSFQQSNYPSYIASLAAELSNAQKPADSRRLAGILLKNSLDARDDARKLELQAKWGQLEGGLRSTIKTALLGTLNSDSPDVRHTASMVVAKVAAIELPFKQWNDLVTSLINNMNTSPGLKQATLEALGYICEEMALLKEEVLTPPEVNMILTAVVAGMRPDEPSQDIRLAATTALSNALEFAEHNFDNEQERNYIMQMVCQGTVAPNAKIRVESFYCLHEIGAGYYRHLPAYMQEVFNITVNAIKNEGEDEDVRLQVRRWATSRPPPPAAAAASAAGGPSAVGPGWQGGSRGLRAGLQRGRVEWGGCDRAGLLRQAPASGTSSQAPGCPGGLLCTRQQASGRRAKPKAAQMQKRGVALPRGRALQLALRLAPSSAPSPLPARPPGCGVLVHGVRPGDRAGRGRLRRQHAVPQVHRGGGAAPGACAAGAADQAGV
jgi:hypothetical protein